MRKRKKAKRTGLGLVAIMVLMICGIVTYKRQDLDKVSEKSGIKIKELNKAIALEEARVQEIKELKAYIQTDEYIEEMAREKLGLVYKDEIIFKSNDD